MELTLALVALAVVLGFAMIRPRGWPEAVAAVPAAGLLIAFGVISWHDASDEVSRLLPVVGFLAAVLVLARLCDDEGLFRAAGATMARSDSGSQQRLLATVFVIAAATTAILSLDATVVLLTPVVLATARALRVPARPHAYATAHLANSASLLFPVSNLTNLLAFGVAGLSFVHFTAVMTLPWLAAVGIEFVLLRRLFARDLSVQPAHDTVLEDVQVPVFVLVVLALTLVGFAVTSLFGLSPAWAALAGAVALGVRALARRETTVAKIADALDVPFLAFVLCLGVVVAAVMLNGLDGAMRDVLPDGDALPRTARHRGGCGAAVQHRQQPACGARAAAVGDGIGSRRGTGGAPRRQRRAEPDLCRLAGESAVAKCRPPRYPRRLRRIQPDRAAHDADHARRRCARPVGRRSDCSVYNSLERVVRKTSETL